VPFGAIPEDFASAYGECTRTLAWFRDVMVPFVAQVDWSVD